MWNACGRWFLPDQQENGTKGNNSSHTRYGHVQATKRDGLGRLPPNLTSAGSLLLFNTKDNPYREYAALDNLALPAWAVVDKKSMLLTLFIH